MSRRLDDFDRNILEQVPSIGFVEPDVEPATPNAADLPPEPLQLEDLEAQRTEIKKLAKAVNALAAATQARADEKAKDMIIKLDKNVDQDAIQAMRRKFPDADPLQISYAQYRQACDDVRKRGEALGREASISPEEVQAARDEAAAAGNLAGTRLGGFGTEFARTGQLRPELNSRGQLIPPLDLEEVQINLICILVNFIWKNFIKKSVTTAATPVGKAFKGLPDKICNPGSDIEIPGLFILGEGIPDLLSGKVAEKSQEEAGL
jgi:hypothetical protein